MFFRMNLICLTIAFTLTAQANSLPTFVEVGISYEQAKTSLIADGWKPVVNAEILRSSLYAQEIFEHGSTEVVDCISMELDACSFRFIKNNRPLEIRTITRELKVDKVKHIKK
jgi:hypothetical protein